MKLHHRFHSALILTLVLLAVSCQVCLAKTVYVKTTGLDTNDGLSWEAAKKTVTAGITASASGDEIWVAAGTYVELITLKTGTGLYGGFAGTEASRDQRNWKTNVTTLNGNKVGNEDGNVVTSPSGATTTTVIDGFTIRNCRYGIHCSGSPLIANNTITATTFDGIYCNYGSPVITNNTITANSGGGIDCYQGSPSISNNTITANNENGIDCTSSSSATITNNTIAGNSGRGVNCAYASATVSNNIVAFNANGIRKQEGGGTLSLRNNCVYGNPGYNYSGVAEGTGYISADPRFASKELGDYHIQPDSPCRDAGYGSAPGIPTTDMDGQARIQGTAVDIGADESDGTVWNVTPIIVRVSADGNDTNDGSTWALAKKTVQAGVDAASTAGGEVWVKAGTYSEPVIILRPCASLYGGFAGTESSRDERNWRTNPTIIDGGGGIAVRFSVPTGAIDGFTIRNCSYGVHCASWSSPTIANNTLAGNGNGVYCYGSPVITNNTITGSTTTGIYCYSSSSPTITNNTISGSGATGISCNFSTGMISNNIVAFNASGIYSVGSTGTLVLRNNCVYGNPSYNYSGLTAGAGDISADPLFASKEWGNCHIQPGSPCRDTGYGSAQGILSLDIDGQDRVQGTSVDIGADESDGTIWNVTPTIVRVSPDGNDANDGSTWTLAKKTVQAGVSAASSAGGEVWVKSGTYIERVTLSPYASMYGGFAGTESSREERNWRTNPTILSGEASGEEYIITVRPSMQGMSVNGFTIRNGTRGINCFPSSSPMIANNTFMGNGITCSSGSLPVIANNIFTRCGIYCGSDSSPTITNNTITGSGSTGIYCDGSTAVISNNIVAFNASGIGRSSTYDEVVLRNNCVYGNPGYNYSKLPAGTGDISVDPMFASKEWGNCHIQPGSPCRDTGYGSALGIPATDVDCQPRVLGTSVDIGADESDGTIWNVTPTIVRVSGDGNDANDGSTWTLAKKTVQAGVSAASSAGGEVWVKSGTYIERVTLSPYASMYGGFAGTESSREERNWRTNPTVIDGGGSGTAVTVNFSAPTGAVDGFAIRNSSTGISCAAWSTPIIANNTITSNSDGIDCNTCSPVIMNNTITGSSTYGLNCSYSSAVITNNTISRNTSAGINCSSSSLVITTNIITGNSSDGISCSSSTPTITNNTVAGNGNRGIYSNGTTGAISNNIIAFNAFGISASGTGVPILMSNCIYGNLGYNYSGLSAGTGDISTDPMFASKEFGKYHIQPGSPCRDTGYGSAQGIPTTDIDGQDRVQDSAVDMGADESDGTIWNITPLIVRVAPDGNDANDGSTWALAKKNVQAGVDAASLAGGEVWVKAGTYRGVVTLRPFASMYGGFAGTESARAERNWRRNPTILSGLGSGYVVAVSFSVLTGAIDGFTIQNGGTGITSAAWASPTIANNTITGNIGDGIYCNISYPMITNNTIRGNSGTGILCSAWASPTITNNTISGSGVTGISCNNPTAVISNNIVAFNASGIYKTGTTGTPVLRNNCVYGNPAYNYSGLSAGIGDISADPLFASKELGDCHIQPGSPCRDTGYGSAQGIPSADIDGQDRVQGSAVDMGADESDGTIWNIEPVVVRVSQYGNDQFDGSTWPLAKRTVRAGLEAVSLTGGEVWVKAGTYTGTIAMRPYASLYGGFAGTESSRDARNWNANPTILAAGLCQDAITVTSSAQIVAIDGFTIQSGVNGISCSSASPVIKNNTITANFNYGINCSSSASPTITNNTITANKGYGIYCTASYPVITNNSITRNSSDGISCSSSSAVITNNSVIENVSNGINCSNSTAAISNNIVAFNATGIGGTGSIVLRNNCVYGNSVSNYSGISDMTGDISVDPRSVNADSGQIHIQPDSPCRNAGNDTAVGAGWLDTDGQARIQGTHVDIGADESDGTWWPTPASAVVRVSPNGNDANNGSTWTLAKRTVQAGANAASAARREVWVASGTYVENVTLPMFANLYGGFTGTETERNQRNWIANTTVLDGHNTGSVVSILSGYKVSGIDGFAIRNGNATNGGGIACTNASPFITNNTITGCTATNGGAISCTNSSPSIANNTITGCTATLGGGIYNIASGPTISANTIYGNTATDGGGIYDVTSTSMVVNNILRANSAGRGGGVFVYSQGTSIQNNTLVDNQCTTHGGGIYCNICTAKIRNNIVAFGQKGLYVYATSGFTPTVSNNCIYGNTGYDYAGITKPGTDVPQDPKFVNKAGGDYHLQATSPCIDRATSMNAPSVDKDGALRPQDGNTDGRAYHDIGVYEYPFFLAKAKSKLAENALFAVIGAPVTAVFASEGRVYVEMPDRTAGIRVDTAQSLAEGQVVNVTGNIYTDAITGERYVAATTGYPQAMGSEMILKPFVFQNAGLGGGVLGLQDGVWSWDLVRTVGDGFARSWVQSSALNNIGLLVTTFGNMTYAGDGFFYVDDGSALNDGSGHVGVKVLATGLTFSSTGFVTVTGISSCEKNADDKIVRLLRVRKQDDITTY